MNNCNHGRDPSWCAACLKAQLVKTGAEMDRLRAVEQAAADVVNAAQQYVKHLEQTGDWMKRQLHRQIQINQHLGDKMQAAGMDCPQEVVHLSVEALADLYPSNTAK